MIVYTIPGLCRKWPAVEDLSRKWPAVEDLMFQEAGSTYDATYEDAGHAL